MPRFLDNITAGSWPDWIAATGTSLAFLVAAVSYSRSVKVRREEQARLVYSKVLSYRSYEAGTRLELFPEGPGEARIVGGMTTITPSSPEEEPYDLATAPVVHLTAVVHNGSKELIGPVKVQVVDRGRGTIYDAFSVVYGAIEPESDLVVCFVWPSLGHPGPLILDTTLIFRDASNQWWRRHRAEPVEAVHDDPENSASTSAERAQLAAEARAMGGEPSPEPRVPLRAQWHRFWRKRRGKSPIP